MPSPGYFSENRQLNIKVYKLEKHLSLLKRHKIINVWHDRDINAGTEWEQQIDAHLNTAQVILLLVSPDFLASDYCYSVEVKRAMEKHEAREACVIPVILRPVLLHWAPFEKLPALPTDAEPVTSNKWHTRDDAWLDVAKGIVEAVSQVIGKVVTAQLLVAFGRENRNAKQYQKALEDYSLAIERDPYYFSAYVERGGLYLELNEYQKAVVDFDRAIQLNPITTHHLYYVRGLAYYALKEYQKAIVDFDRALQINPEDIGSSLNRAHVYFALKEYQKAIADYDHVIQLAPTNTQAYLNRGKSSFHLKNPQKAIADFDRALQIDPNDVEILYVRAGFYLVCEDYQKAIADYDRILTLNPNHAQAKRAREDVLSFTQEKDA